MSDTVPGTVIPIRMSVRLLPDDGDPWPGAVAHVVFATDTGREHRLTIAPAASDSDLGSALRQVIALELARRDAEETGKTPDERRADMRELSLARNNSDDDEGAAHAARFRQVANRYPRRVAEAYGGDLTRAAGDSDGQVAATVAAWERRQGVPVLDWPAIGAAERGEDPS